MERIAEVRANPDAPAGDADITAVVVRNGVVLYAPGELNLGRTIRLANRAQRRALRGLYACCAIPGCTLTLPDGTIHTTAPPHRRTAA